jgi:hypothetical protein
MNATLDLLRIKAGIPFKDKQHLIKEKDVIDWLGNEFPVINFDLERTSNPSNIYNVMRCFADLTKQLVKKGNFKEVKHCFIVAEKILQKGNGTVKNAVENCYLFSLSTIIDIANPASIKVKKLLTRSLKKEYNRQIFASGL